jgi:hypothetical protein
MRADPIGSAPALERGANFSDRPGRVDPSNPIHDFN